MQDQFEVFKELINTFLIDKKRRKKTASRIVFKYSNGVRSKYTDIRKSL